MARAQIRDEAEKVTAVRVEPAEQRRVALAAGPVVVVAQHLERDHQGDPVSARPGGPSALTHSVDSCRGETVLCWGHGTTGLSVGLDGGSPALGGDPRRSQSAAEAWGAGTGHSRLGRAAGRGG